MREQGGLQVGPPCQATSQTSPGHFVPLVSPYLRHSFHSKSQGSFFSPADQKPPKGPGSTYKSGKEHPPPWRHHHQAHFVPNIYWAPGGDR